MSKRLLVAACTFVGVLVVGACSNQGIQGSGNLQTTTRPVQGFNSIALSVNGDLNVSRTGTESLSVQADDNIIPHLTVQVTNGVLELGVDDRFGATGHIVFTVTTKELRSITVNGSGHVTAADVNAPAFDTTISGDGNVHLAGSAQSQTIAINGDGTFEGTDFSTRSANVTVSGSGRVAVNASDRLQLDTVEPSEVDYKGSPKVTQAGQGKVKSLG